jgi:hypothetical protein
MEVVKSTKANKKEKPPINPDTLKRYLYQKEVLEHHLVMLEEGLKVYTDLISELQAQSNLGVITVKDKVLLMETKNKAQELAVQLRNTISSYESLKYKMGKLYENYSFNEKDAQFNSTKENASRLAENEIYGSIDTLPANIEQTKVMQDLREFISLKEKELAHYELQSDPVSAVKVFEIKRQLITLQKRLDNRIRYHNEVFLPMYNADMNECRRYLKEYIARGKKFAESGIDLVVGEAIKQYEKGHKNDKESLWLFYTSLRNRVDAAIVEMKKQPNLPPQFRNYLIPIRK